MTLCDHDAVLLSLSSSSARSFSVYGRSSYLGFQGNRLKCES
jgi:hypothetical protein